MIRFEGCWAYQYDDTKERLLEKNIQLIYWFPRRSVELSGFEMEGWLPLGYANGSNTLQKMYHLLEMQEVTDAINTSKV